LSTAVPSRSTAPIQQGGGYQISRPQGKCAVCGGPIAPEQRYMAALRELPAGFERVDIDAACWTSFDKSDLLGYWQSVMPNAQQKKQLFVDDEVLCNLFERLADATEPSKLSFRFVLGLILMRKRLRVYESSRTDAQGRERWQLRPRGRQDSLEMLNPHLDESQVAQVSQQLSAILNEEL